MSKAKLLLLALTCLMYIGCASSTPNAATSARLAETAASARTAETTSDLAGIDEMRTERRLADSRAKALETLAQHPDDPEVLWRASRAESDEVYMLSGDDKKGRNEAARHALELSKQALKSGAVTAEARAQHAWAMGNATHLQPMMSRSSHARATKKVIDSVLEEDMNQPTALATAALLQYRLNTLPTMIKIMAFTAPSSDLDRAERYALAAQELEPSRLNALILAKINLAQKKGAVAAEVLRTSIEAPDQFPRDEELKAELEELLASCEKSNP